MLKDMLLQLLKVSHRDSKDRTGFIKTTILHMTMMQTIPTTTSPPVIQWRGRKLMVAGLHFHNAFLL